jgi:succinylglutamate desuccinylase
MKIRKIKSGIFVLDSEINGPSVSIFSGVHGNELAGIEAVKKAIEKVKIKKGKVYFVFANEEAILRNTRYVQKNLNRCFLKEIIIKKLKTY